MKRWYVIHVYAGYEESVKADLEKRVKEEHFEDYVGQILVPATKVKDIVAVDKLKDQQLFPGYVIIEAEITPELFRLVMSCPRVLRFLGGKDPLPLAKKEVDRIISQVKGDFVIAQEKEHFVVGSEVEIKEGPFAGFVGYIDKVDEESERLTVMVSIFGRMTPVELNFDQIK